jgi:hypothetical protein
MELHPNRKNASTKKTVFCFLPSSSSLNSTRTIKLFIEQHRQQTTMDEVSGSNECDAFNEPCRSVGRVRSEQGKGMVEK